MGERKRIAPWVRFLPFAVLLFFLGAAFLYQEGIEARATLGEQAPDFTLKDLSGNDVSLSGYLGRPVIVNFWTTWCPECREEVGALRAIAAKYGDRVAVVGVNMREPATVVRAYARENQMTYRLLLDRSERVAKSYRVTGVPETWFVAADGTAVAHHIGAITLEQLENAVVQLTTAGSREPATGGV